MGRGGGIGAKGVKEHFALRCLVQLYLSLDVEGEKYSHSQNIGDLYLKQETVNGYFLCLVTGKSRFICEGLTLVFNRQTPSMCTYFH